MSTKYKIDKSASPATLADNLAVMFIGLKLAGFIDWSWWLVLLPIYAPWIFVFILEISKAIFKK